MADQILTQNRLKELLDYDPETGIFTWRAPRRGVTAGKIAGRTQPNGYRQVRVNMRFYLAHRLAWLYTYGVWPNNEIDHINRCKSDNRICNLRDVSRSENMRNTALFKTNTSGEKGVRWNTSSKKWTAHVPLKKKWHHLGYYKSFADAVQARKIGEIILGWR